MSLRPPARGRGRMTTTITATFTPSDAAALNGSEKLIEQGLTAFATAGRAMLAVSEQRLYRQTHSTFSAYCAERWGMSDRHVRRLMLAADVVEKMTALVGPMGPIPTTERQARELVGLDPDLAILVMETVTATAPMVTATAIAQARRELEKFAPDSVVMPPATQRRKPLSDEMREAMADLEKLSRKFDRIRRDDRYGAFSEHFRSAHSGRLDSITTELVEMLADLRETS